MHRLLLQCLIDSKRAVDDLLFSQLREWPKMILQSCSDHLILSGRGYGKWKMLRARISRSIQSANEKMRAATWNSSVDYHGMRC